MADKLKITLVKSTIGAIPKHRATVAGSWPEVKSTRLLRLPDNCSCQRNDCTGTAFSES